MCKWIVNLRRKDSKIPVFNMEQRFSQFEHLEKNSPACPSAADGRTLWWLVVIVQSARRRASSEPHNHEESVCETTCSAIVLLGLASSEKPRKACNQIKGCWEGEGSSTGNSKGVVEVLISTCHWSVEEGLNNAAGGEAGAKLDGQIGLLLLGDNGTMREGKAIGEHKVGENRCNGEEEERVELQRWRPCSVLPCQLHHLCELIGAGCRVHLL